MVFELDKEFEIFVFSPTCTLCLHLTDLGARQCKAFPGGIPLPIWNGDNKHTAPYAGDHGIRYEPLPKDKANA